MISLTILNHNYLFYINFEKKKLKVDGLYNITNYRNIDTY